jgi:transposase InsO family protein
MTEASLIGRAGRVYRRIPGIERFYERHRNIRLNQPAPTELNQQWVADLTYIRVGNEWRYLAVVLDVYSRKVIRWSLGSRKTADLTLRALRHALRVRVPRPGLILHTDRGVEYEAYLSQNELGRHGFSPALIGPDNARAMRIWSRLSTA